LRGGGLAMVVLVLLSSFPLVASAGEVHRCAATGDVDRLARLLDGSPALVEALDEYGMSPLHWAAFVGHKGTVDMLLERGANPNRRAGQGKPFAEVDYGDGARVPEVIAAVWGTNRVERAVGITPLHLAAHCRSPGIVASLLQAGADVNAKAEEGGFTPLHLAATRAARAVDMVAVLVAEGANLEAGDANGATPLHWAALLGRLDTVQALLSHGAKPDAIDNRFATPFQYARLMSRGDVMRVLRAAGAQVRMKEPAAWDLDYFREHVRLRLWAEPYYPSGSVRIQLELSNSGSLPIWPPVAADEFRVLVDRKRRRPMEWGASAMVATPIHPKAPRVRNWWKSENEVKVWLVPGRHELYFELGPVSSNVLVIGVPEEGAITYRPRLAELSWRKARPGTKEREGETPLHKAAWAGDIEWVRELLGSEADVDAGNSLGETALHYATMRGFVGIARELIAAGADAGAAAQDGWTVLHQAAMDGDAEIAGLLLGAGADANATDDRGRFPLGIALRWRRKEVAHLLRDRSPRRDVFVASALGEVEALERFLEREPDLVTARYASGTGAEADPLHFAVIWGQRAAAELLLERGASPRAASDNVEPPLTIAAARGDAAIARMLIRSGAPVEDRGPNWPSALFASASLGHPDVVELLLQDGADHGLRNWLQRTPLHVAAENGDARTARLLIAAGADVNAEATNDQTALHLAVSEGHLEFARVLLEGGADPNAMQPLGGTPLHEAAWKGRADIAELLLRAGARPDAMDMRGRTPLDAAVERGYTQVEALLRKHGETE